MLLPDIMKRIITTVFIALAVAISASPLEIDADIAPKPLTVQETIVKQATYYAAPVKKMTALFRCESHFNQHLIGEEGEIGIAQYKKGTFITMSNAMGEKLDINSWSDQIKLTTWVWANHPEWMRQWTTWRALENGGVYTFTSRQTGKTYTIVCNE